MKTILKIYIFLMPFMSALAPFEWIPLPLLFMLLISPFIVIANPISVLRLVTIRDVGFICMWVLGCFAIMNSPIPVGQKNINYTIAVIVTYVFFFAFVRRLLFVSNVSLHEIGKIACFVLMILSVSIVIEFFLASKYSLFWSDIIPFGHENLPVANFFNEDFKRPRAFSAEPGFTSLAYDCFWPLVFIGFKRNIRTLIMHIFFLIAYCMLASVASMLALLVSTVFAVVYFRGIKTFIKPALLILLIVSLLLSSDFAQNTYWNLIGRKLDIINIGDTRENDSATLSDRLDKYALAKDIIIKYPLGIGWGALGQGYHDKISIDKLHQLNGSGLLNLYLDFLVASGLIGLLFWIIFHSSRFFCLMNSSNPNKIYLIISLMSLSIHHIFITEFQYPFLWLSLALADMLSMRSKTILKS